MQLEPWVIALEKLNNIHATWQQILSLIDADFDYSESIILRESE